MGTDRSLSRAWSFCGSIPVGAGKSVRLTGQNFDEENGEGCDFSEADAVARGLNDPFPVDSPPMKISAFPVCLIVCLAPLGFTLGCVGSANQIPFSHAANYVEHGDSLFGRGTPRAVVRGILGPPYRELNPNIWIYRHFSGGAAQLPFDDCDSLVVVFSEDCVADLTLINDRAEDVLAARMQRRTEETIASAGK
jgi:hypothetical protein